MRIALICSHGGHLTETLQVLDAFRRYSFFWVTHFSARDDEVRRIAPAYFCRNIGKRPLRLLWAFFWALGILLRERPAVIFSTGAEIALPFFFWSRILGIRSIFLESWCRVTGLSQTGRIVYHLATEFWVQWPQLVERCGPKARYHGAVV